MSIRDQQEQELKHLRNVIESINEAWGTGFFNDDGDKVISEEKADKISALLE